jgi:small subunit ribosomal protein S27e
MPQEPPEEVVHPGRFARVECNDCGNTQVIFVRTASQIPCHVCGDVIAKPTGGVAEYVGTFQEYVE